MREHNDRSTRHISAILIAAIVASLIVPVYLVRSHQRAELEVMR